MRSGECQTRVEDGRVRCYGDVRECERACRCSDQWTANHMIMVECELECAE